MERPEQVPDHTLDEAGRKPFLAPGSATWQDFERLDLRVGRIVEALPFPEARTPAYRLTIDFGPGGRKRSSARLPPTYPDPAALVGRLVVCVVNFPARRIAMFESEVLVLGALPADGRIPLLGVDDGASPGDPVG
jgi:tRNA-binding protein